MKDQTRINSELLKENSSLNQRIQELEQAESDRKQVEDALRVSEENFRRSLNESPLGVRVVTVEGKTLYANQAILDIYGYDSTEELATTPVEKRYTPASYAEYQIRRENRKRGVVVPSEYEISIVRKNGEIRHLQVFRKEAIWNGARQFQVIYHDITERKRTEEALKISSQLLRDTGEMAKVGGWELDLSTKEVLWTEEVGRIHGVEPGYKPKLEEALNFYAPESRPALEAVLKKAMETGEPYDLESLFIPSGSKDKIWIRSLGKAVYSGGKIVKLAGTFQNIDEYKRAEETLRESEQKYRELFESTSEAIIIMDLNGKITDANRTVEEYGHTRDYLLGKSIFDFIPVNHRARAAKDFDELCHGTAVKGEMEVIGPKGNLTVEYRDNPIVRGGQIVAVQAILTDITERKMVADKLMRLSRILKMIDVAIGT